MSRIRAFIVMAAVTVVTGGCAGPVALQVASVAADGVSVLTTGKGATDHALSELAGENCRLSNVLKSRPICRAHEQRPKALADAVFGPSLPTPHAHALVNPAEIAAAAAVAPAAGIEVRSTMSPGMNMAEVIGAPFGARLSGTLQADGTLRVRLIGGDGAAQDRVLFDVPGYARNPGAFTGVVMGERFFAPDSFVR